MTVEPENPYASPPALVEEPLFSPAAQTRMVRQIAMLQLPLVTLLPALFVVCGEVFVVGMVLRAAVAVGLAVGAAVLMMNYFAVAGVAKLARPIAERLAQHGENVESATFAAFAPAGTLQIYGPGMCCWDLGFVRLHRDSLVYVGEKTQFEIPRNHVASIRIANICTTWIPALSIFIHWCDEVGKSGAICLDPAEVHSVRQSRKITAEFAHELQRWLEQPEAPAAVSQVSRFPLPSVEGATSQPVKKCVRRALRTALPLMAVQGIGVAFLLSVFILKMPLRWDVGLTVALSTVFVQFLLLLPAACWPESKGRRIQGAATLNVNRPVKSAKAVIRQRRAD